MMPQPTLLGAEIRRLRKLKQMSLVTLTDRMGWKSTGPLLKIERGKRLPQPNTIAALVNCLGATSADLYYLLGLAGNIPETELPATSKVVEVLESVAGILRQCAFPAYVIDYQWRFWIVNPAVAMLVGSLDYLQALLRRQVNGFDVIFDSRLGIRSRIQDSDAVYREQIWRFKATNLYRRHEPFYLAYPQCMAGRLLPEDYAFFAKIWAQAESSSMTPYALSDFGFLPGGFLKVAFPDTGKTLAFNLFTSRILHLDSLFELIRYFPVDASTGQPEPFMAAPVANDAGCLKRWELVDV